MSFNWWEYIVFAKEILNQNTEVSCRVAISRAYYGAFCLVRNKKGYKDYQGTENLHWKIINELKDSEDKKDQQIGRMLDKLRKAKNEADYNEDKKIDKKLAERVVLTANQILSFIGGITGSTHRGS